MMKPHDYYTEVSGRNHPEFGAELGQRFTGFTREFLDGEKAKSEAVWAGKIKHTKKFLPLTQAEFPEYIAELKAYAEAAYPFPVN